MTWLPITVAQRGVLLALVDITPNGMLWMVNGDPGGT
jgi:hypothetical protein